MVGCGVGCNADDADCFSLHHCLCHCEVYFFVFERSETQPRLLVIAFSLGELQFRDSCHETSAIRCKSENLY